MKTITTFLIAFSLSVFAACGQYNSSKYGPPKYKPPITSDTAILKTALSSLDLEDPENDFSKNIGNKDYRFIGVCGIACYAPGVTSEENVHFIKKYGLRILDGTSDAIEGVEHAELIKLNKQRHILKNIMKSF